MAMKFPKLSMTGLIKTPKIKPVDSALADPIKPIKSLVTKFTGIKRELTKEKNLGKKYKI